MDHGSRGRMDHGTLVWWLIRAGRGDLDRPIYTSPVVVSRGTSRRPLVRVTHLPAPFCLCRSGLYILLSCPLDRVTLEPEDGSSILAGRSAIGVGHSEKAVVYSGP